MRVRLELSDPDKAHIIANLWPLYQHDVSRFDGSTPNRHGVFNDDESVVSLAQHAESLGPWWREARSLFPYLILADGAPAGFNLIASRSRLPEGVDADFAVHEFFVLHAYRGTRAGEQAAIEGFDRHRGRWEVVTHPTNARGIAFWRRVIRTYTSGRYSEGEVDHPWGRKVAFHFQSD